ncbi:MAG TPA: tetratricopeptide repeat protein [Holophagaceae bacterium]
MNRNILLALAGGLVVGGLLGYFIGANSGGSGSSMVVAAPVAAVPVAPGAMPSPMPGGTPGAAPTAAQQQNTAALERATLQDPKNRPAWVELGNAYFDSNQPQKAVTAYAKALALQGDDPNVLTDQGVMFRELGQFDKAVANFQKAQKLDPKHLQSLFNLGIVYANDLHKPAEATAAWNRIITLAPDSQQAGQARQALAQLKAGAPH